MRVRLNIDLGELPDEPAELYALAHIANIACGGHAGDDASMSAALAMCARHGAVPAAHPSYPDREGFGRTRLALAPAAIEQVVRAQCARLARLAGRSQTIRMMKPHGALYHAADGDRALAEAVCAGACAALGDGAAVIGPGAGALAAAAAAAGMPLLREGFADRARVRGADGRWTLVARGQAGALIDDPAAAAALARTLVAEQSVETICVHGDGARALEVARAVRALLGGRS